MNSKRFFTIIIGLASALSGQAQTLDPTFGTDGLVETYYGLYVESKVHDMLLQPDGKIVVCGTTYVNSYDFMMIRYLPDGTLDPSFGDNGKAFIDFGNLNDFGIGYALQPDGKIVVTGYSETPNYESISIARINADGTKDLSFGDNGIIYQTTGDYECFGSDVVVQSDGKILVAGHGIYTPQGEDFFLARYNEDGSLDTSFAGDGKVENINDNNSGTRPVMTLQADGNILISGMGRVGSQQHYCTMRFFANGALDTSFSDDGVQLTLVPGDYNWPGNIVVQQDQKIVIAGYSGYWQSEMFSIIRLDANGNPDSDFASNGIFTHSINPGLDLFQDVLIQPDGKILACGYTIGPDGTYDFIAMRLMEDGSIDTTFGNNGALNQAFSYTESRAVAMAIQQDGKLLIAGDAPDFLNHHTAVARYDAGIPATVAYDNVFMNTLQVFPNPAQSFITIALPDTEKNTSIFMYDMLGKVVTQLITARTSTIDIRHLHSGMYTLQAVDSQGRTYRAGIIKE